MKILAKSLLTTFIFIALLAPQTQAQWDQILNLPDYSFQTVYFKNDSTGFIAGHNSIGIMAMMTTDYGATWNIVHQEDSGNWLYDFDFPTEDIGYMSAHSNVLKTTDGGLSWFYPNPDFEGYPYRSIAFQDELVGYGCFADGAAAFARTADGGQTWVEQYDLGGRKLLKTGDCSFSMMSGYIRSTTDCWDSMDEFLPVEGATQLDFALNDDGDIISCGIGLYQATLQNYGFINKWNQSTGTSTLTEYPQFLKLKAIQWVNESEVYCVGSPYSSAPSPFLKSNDGGVTWYYQEFEALCADCPSFGLIGLHFPSEAVGYAISQSGLLYRTFNGGGELIPMNVVENEVDLELTLQPNPANAELSLSWSHRVFSEATITLRTLEGKIIIEETVFNTNQHQIDTSDLPNGFYLLSLSNKQAIHTKQVVVAH